MSSPPETLPDSLDAVETELKSLGLWQAAPPVGNGLTSRAPFCHDTLSLPQWLQWIFLPGMRALLEGGHTLPETCDIAPYAREVLKNDPGTTRLIVLIKRCDRLITES